jgi:hypothetical protein
MSYEEEEDTCQVQPRLSYEEEEDTCHMRRRRIHVI